jgi:hypothetical protein
MSGHGDNHFHDLFENANDAIDHSAIDHSDYKSTEDYDQPLHYDPSNHVEDTSFGRTADIHSQVQHPGNSLQNNQNRQCIVQNAYEIASKQSLSPNEFIDALLNGDLSMNTTNDTSNQLDMLINSGQFTDNAGSTIDWNTSDKGSKWKNGVDDDDNQNIHGGDTSNACDEDANSPGSSQQSNYLGNHYDKPCSSSSSSPAVVVLPTSPGSDIDTLREAKVEEGIDHDTIEYHIEPTIQRDQSEHIWRGPSGIQVGPIPPKVILPSPVQQIPVVPLTTIVDPLNSNNHYQVDKQKLSDFLTVHGKQVSGRKRKSKEEIERLIKRFCDPKELEYCSENDAHDILNSDFEVKNVPLRGRSEIGKYSCKFCPITQKHERGFDRKEDMKRHYHQHLNFVRFSCKHCEYKNARTDHMKNHMKKCHPEIDSSDYNRNS